MPIRERRLSGDTVEEEQTFMREYDEHGNWLKECCRITDSKLGSLFYLDEPEQKQSYWYRPIG